MAVLSSSTLLGVFRETKPLRTFWMDRFFNRQVMFDTDTIDFEKISRGPRKLAPFVTPMSQGVPIFTESSAVSTMKAAYIKVKDPITAGTIVSRRPGSLISLTPPSPAQVAADTAAAILLQHDEAITRREEWMAANAIISGKYTVSGDAYPARLVDFGRAAGHTVTLGSGARWGDSGVSITGLLTAWRYTMGQAPFGGRPSTLIMGADAYEAFRTDAAIQKLLDTQYRGSNADFKTGLLQGIEAEYVGSLDGVMDIIVYSDYYQDETGTAVPILDSKSIVMVGANVDGVRAYGAIKDHRAGFQALTRFPKSWQEEDPSAEFLMTQSAPLMVPVNPNATFTAKVLA